MGNDDTFIFELKPYQRKYLDALAIAQRREMIEQASPDIRALVTKRRAEELARQPIRRPISVVVDEYATFDRARLKG